MYNSRAFHTFAFVKERDMCEHFFTKTQEPYSLLLERREWAAKRQIILNRDNNCCQHCGKTADADTLLHVHHKHYISGLDPWEYKDSELITLCEECHSFYHAHYRVPVYKLDSSGNLVEITYTPCRRCGGSGYFPQYKHVQGGVCFRCHGARYEELISVVESYAVEYNIRIEDLDDGFRPLNPEAQESIEEVRVLQSQFDSNKCYLRIKTKDNKQINAFLDYSVSAKPGDKLDTSSIWYKKQMSRTGKEYLVVKGIPLYANSE